MFAFYLVIRKNGKRRIYTYTHIAYTHTRKAQRYTKVVTIAAGSIHIRMIRKKAKNRRRRGQTHRGVGKKKSVSGAGHGS